MHHRMRRMEWLEVLDAPEFIKKFEQHLIDKAWYNVLTWDLFYTSAWEVDIVTGEFTVHEVSEVGHMAMALLSCRDDDDTEETELQLL